MQTYIGANHANMQKQKTCEYAKGQKMQTYNGACKHANIMQAWAQNMQTFKVAKDANIQRRKTCKHAKAANHCKHAKGKTCTKTANIQR